VRVAIVTHVIEIYNKLRWGPS